MTFEEHKDYCNKKILLKYIKTGKRPKRHGLLWRLLDLIDAREFNSSSIFPVKNNKEYDRVLKVWYPSTDILDIFRSKQFNDIIKTYLGPNCVLDTRYSNTSYIYYKNENLDWLRLDYDLIQKYPKGVYEKDGAYFRK